MGGPAHAQVSFASPLFGGTPMAAARLLAVLVLAPAVAIGLTRSSGSGPTLSDAGTTMPRLPFSTRAPLFTENLGQWPISARFVGRLGGLVARAEPAGLGLQLQRDEKSGVFLRLVFEGADASAPIVGEQPREASFSYFIGKDPTKWVRGARSFDAVRWCHLYEGVDLVLRAQGDRLKYDLHLAPGVVPSTVRIRVEGADGLSLNELGELVIHTTLGDLVQPQPRSFQIEIEGDEQAVRVVYELTGSDSFRLKLDEYDPSLPLVIDPELVWSTYLGAAIANLYGDWAASVAIGPAGDVFVAGLSYGANFPTTPGDFVQGSAQANAFVARMRASDGALLYGCLVGGTQDAFGSSTLYQRARAIAVDSQGFATVAGDTSTNDFPTTPGAFQQQTNGPDDAFVFRLTPGGDQLLWSTLLGGGWDDDAYTVAVAPSGAAVVGGTPSHGSVGGFPTTPGAYQPSYNSTNPSFTLGYLSRLDPTGSFLEWSTLIDVADVTDIALAANESVIFMGRIGPLSPVQATPGAWAPPPPPSPDSQVYVARMNASGTAVEWVSTFGGGDAELPEALSLDAFGGPVVVGRTPSYDFPTTPGTIQTSSPGGYHGFAVRLKPDGSAPVYSTYLGTSFPIDVTADASGLATVTGQGWGQSLLTPGAYQTSSSGHPDLFVSRISPRGDRLFYSTLIAGPNTEEGYAIAQSASRRVTVAGYCNGGYPTTPNAAFPNYQGGQTDAVVTTFDLVLEGLELQSSSIPGCLGPIHLNGTRMPVAGAADFALFASGAPPSANGFLVIGQPLAAPVPGNWLGLNGPLQRIPVQADSHGYVERAWSLASYAAGQSFAARYVFRSPASCAGATSRSASNVLIVTVQ